MTAEEAIKRIQDHMDVHRIGDYPHIKLRKALNMAISALREQEERRWIPVTERLPKLIPCSAGTAYSEAVNVLTTGRKVLTAIYDGNDFIADAEFWDAEGEGITHWKPVLLPLPEPRRRDDYGYLSYLQTCRNTKL